MTPFIAEARQTLVPGSEVKHGPLPPLLVGISHVSIVLPLVLALIVVALIAGTAQLLSRTDAAWVRAG